MIKTTVLVEDSSISPAYRHKAGLSLYIESDSSKPLFRVITIKALMLFGVCFPFYAYGLARIKLSAAQPIFAVGTFIFAALMAFFLFHDGFSVLKICGLSVIIVGVIMVANG